LPPTISFIIRSAITPFASAASFIKEVNFLRLILLRVDRDGRGHGRNPFFAALPLMAADDPMRGHSGTMDGES
jgi:hypothetical protein